MKKQTSLNIEKRLIPTYEPKKSIEMPMFFEKKPYQGASGRLYPLQFTDSLCNEKHDRQYTVGILENDYIRIEVIPELGGKVSRAWDKTGKYDFAYYNSVVKPAMIGLAGPWISGGIEFNWPQHHRPTTFLPMEYSVEENDSGEKTIWMGEVEPFQRMKGMVGISVMPGKSYFKAKVRVENTTKFAHQFMWWANLAVPVNKDYQVVFPPDTEYVNDHDRRAVINWPIAKGWYHTARAFNYGEGTDLSRYPNVKVPTSFMIAEGQSDMDFVSGYDHAEGKGIVAGGDHRIVSGKKLFHWGDSDFGNMWSSNLTDTDGPYVELMTGVYTDNQPDFSWIMPGETRTFEQYWYPIREIGAVKNATLDAAVNLEKNSNTLFAGVQVTDTFKDVTIQIFYNKKEIFKTTEDLDPAMSYTKKLEVDETMNQEDFSIEVSAANCSLVSFSFPVRGKKEAIKPREPVANPGEINTVDELFINGLHLEQYKQHNWDPLDYYFEGIKRDPLDIRCNTAIGRIYLKNGRFQECLKFFDKAIERLMSRNTHPFDTEALYLKGLALRYLERYEEAEKWFGKALWHYSYRSPAYFEAAMIKAKRNDYTGALEDLDASLDTNARNTTAQVMKAALYRKIGNTKEALSLVNKVLAGDCLNLAARIEKFFISSEMDLWDKSVTMFGSKAQNAIDAAIMYMNGGFIKEARDCLNLSSQKCLILEYYRLKIDPDYIIDTKDLTICYPNRLEDIDILHNAERVFTDSPEPSYLLGNLLYDRFQYENAVKEWRKSISRNPEHVYSLRNLAIAYFDKFDDGKASRICMEKAFEISHDSRIFYELQQLLKNTDVSDDYRLGLYSKFPEIMEQRDDCYLDNIILLTKKKMFSAATKLLNSRTFHIYEGGEGKLTKHHGWLYTIMAVNELNNENISESLKNLELAQTIPATYGEAKSWLAQESHINYFKGLIAEKNKKEAKKFYEKASLNPSAVTEISLFRALALQKLQRFDEAADVLDEMYNLGANKIINCDRRSYFGVGAVTPMPFEYNIKKINTVEGHILKAFALLGFGKSLAADQEIEKAGNLIPNDFRIFVYKEIACRV